MIELVKKDRVVNLILKNPPVNILDMAILNELSGILENLAEDESISCCLLRGEGKCFSAGASVEEHKPEHADSMLTALRKGCRSLSSLPFPSVALVHGACLGGALELISFCDYVIADPSSTFGLPEINLAFFPPFACSVLSGITGRQNAAFLIFSGEVIDAESARNMGLVQKIIKKEEWETVENHFNTISLPVGRLAKKAFLTGCPAVKEEALEEMKALFLTHLYKFEDVSEGITSFKEKRKPAWKHR